MCIRDRFQAFNRGAFLIYGGQESAETNTPSLFDIDKVHWGSHELSEYLTRLSKLKKHPAQVNGKFIIIHDQPAIVAYWMHPGNNLVGVFNVLGNTGECPIDLPDGSYLDLLSNEWIPVIQGKVTLPQSAMILSADGTLADLEPVYSSLLDYHP
jgi:hypothetical protein